MKQNIYKVLNTGLYSLLNRTNNMNQLTEQYHIQKVFLEKPWKELTYTDIKKASKKKSKGYIYGVLNEMVNNKLLKVKKVGRSILYSLNFESSSTYTYMGFLEEYRAWTSKTIPLQIIHNLKEKMPTLFFILLVTGSYAKGKEHKNSDLDVVIICDNEVDPKTIIAELDQEAQLSIPHVHLHVFTQSEVLEMLRDKKENFGKEFVRHHLIFIGGSIYLTLVKEGLDNGFKG